MTTWYPYRWLCKKCSAIHYYDASSTGCGRCKHNEFTCQVNNQARVDQLKPAQRVYLADGSSPQVAELIQAAEPVTVPAKSPKEAKPPKAAKPVVEKPAAAKPADVTPVKLSDDEFDDIISEFEL